MPKNIDIKGDKVTPNECQLKSGEIKEEETLNSMVGYYLLPVLLHLNKRATQSELQTIVKCTIGLKAPYLFHLGGDYDPVTFQLIKEDRLSKTGSCN